MSLALAAEQRLYDAMKGEAIMVGEKRIATATRASNAAETARMRGSSATVEVAQVRVYSGATVSQMGHGMSNQFGRGGMGSHKHATSGHSGPSPKAKHNRARQATQDAQQRQKRAAKRRVADLYPSVSEAMAARKK